MRYIIFAVLLLCASCGKKLKCSNPSIQADITTKSYDSSINGCLYILKKYKKSTDYTVLIDSITDTAGEDINRPLSDDADYYFEIPATGAVYKISDIYFIEKKGARGSNFLTTMGPQA